MYVAPSGGSNVRFYLDRFNLSVNILQNLGLFFLFFNPFFEIQTAGFHQVWFSCRLSRTETASSTPSMSNILLCISPWPVTDM